MGKHNAESKFSPVQMLDNKHVPVFATLSSSVALLGKWTALTSGTVIAYTGTGEDAQLLGILCADSDQIKSLSCKPCTGIVEFLLHFLLIVDNRVGQ